MGTIKRIGVLTGGGDCPGLNAVIRAVVKTGLLDHGFEAWGILDGFDGLVRNNMVELGYEDVSGILTQGGTILGTSNTAHPFQYVPPGGEPGRRRGPLRRLPEELPGRRPRRALLHRRRRHAHHRPPARR